MTPRALEKAQELGGEIVPELESLQSKLMLAGEVSLGIVALVAACLLAAVRAAANAQKMGVWVVEQHLAQALKVADRVDVMRRGRIVLSGTGENMRGRLTELEESYLSGPETVDVKIDI